MCEDLHFITEPAKNVTKKKRNAHGLAGLVLRGMESDSGCVWQGWGSQWHNRHTVGWPAPALLASAMGACHSRQAEASFGILCALEASRTWLNGPTAHLPKRRRRGSVCSSALVHATVMHDVKSAWPRIVACACKHYHACSEQPVVPALNPTA